MLRCGVPSSGDDLYVIISYMLKYVRYKVIAFKLLRQVYWFIRIMKKALKYGFFMFIINIFIDGMDNNI